MLFNPQTIFPFHHLRRQQQTDKPEASGLWRTSEFYAYYAIIFWSLLTALHAAYNFSSSEHPAYAKYSHLLSRGWMIPGRMLDNSDPQWGGFRQSLPKLTALLTLFTLAYRVKSIHFRFPLTLAAMLLLHGSNVIKIMAIATPCYYFSTLRRKYLGPGLTWIFVISALFIIEWYSWGFGQIHPNLSLLDNFHGFYKRWNIIFKISCLRIISFALDRYWSYSNRAGSESYEEIGYRARIEGSTVQPEDYSFRNYFCYVFFLPLYFAGPIITFNDFQFQLKNRKAQVDYRSAFKYFARVLGCFLLLEMMLHLFHPVAIKQVKAFTGFSPLDFGILAFLNLKVIWLKLLVIWRYFRFFALLNQIDPPENMVRCMTNNYSGLAFWRSWHRSFYLWILRYMYIPLGGSQFGALNIWPIFTFVAIWHDIELNLLAWGWLICLFILPELLCRKLLRPRLENWKHYRHLAAIAASISILMMMTANLVGFAVGLDGFQLMLQGIFTKRGVFFLCCLSCALFSTSQVMLEWRREEVRRGIINNF